MSDNIPKTVEHNHTNQFRWTDYQIVAHVTARHDTDDKPWLTAEPHSAASIDYLMRLHEEAHRDDPVSFEGLVKPDWAK